MSNEACACCFDIYRYDSARDERTLVYRNEHGHVADDISRRPQVVAMTKLNITNDSDIYLWNAEKRVADTPDPAQGRVALTRQVNKPLIVLQGVNDARVLKAESDDVVAAVKKIGPAGRVRGVCGRGTAVHEEEAD